MFSSTVRRVAVAALAMPVLLVTAAVSASADVPDQDGSSYDFTAAAAGTFGYGTAGAMAVSAHGSTTGDNGTWWPSTEHHGSGAIAGTTNDDGVLPLVHESHHVRPWTAPQSTDTTDGVVTTETPVVHSVAVQPQHRPIATIAHRPSRPAVGHVHHRPAWHNSDWTGAQYDHTTAAAGIDGAAVDSTESSAYNGYSHHNGYGHHNGHWSSTTTSADFEHVTASAGMDGADVLQTSSSAGHSTGHGHGHTWAEHSESSVHAGYDGAWIDGTSSGARG